MLRNFFWPKVLRTADCKKSCFQQDGATHHTAIAVHDKKFLNINSLQKIKMVPSSPDLNPCDFYLSGHLKQVLYNPLPETLDDLKVNLERNKKHVNY